MMKAMKRTFLVGASMLALTLSASAQTGGTAEFQAYQANWIQSNNVTTMTPELYDQMKTDWMNSLAPVRQVPVELSIAEKQAIKDDYTRQEMGVPSDYPIMQNTGNAQLDQENYYAAKQLWIQNNQAGYNQMITTPTLTAAQREHIRQQELDNQ